MCTKYFHSPKNQQIGYLQVTKQRLLTLMFLNSQYSSHWCKIVFLESSNMLHTSGPNTAKTAQIVLYLKRFWCVSFRVFQCAFHFVSTSMNLILLWICGHTPLSLEK